MPHLTPEDVIFTLSALPHRAGENERIYLRLIERLSLPEMLEFIKVQDFDAYYKSLFEKLLELYRYGLTTSRKYRLDSLKLFLSKLDAAIELLAETPEKILIVTQLKQNPRLPRIALDLASQTNDRKLFDKLMQFVDVQQLDALARNLDNYASQGQLNFTTSYDYAKQERSFVTRCILESVSDEAFNELILVPLVRQNLVYNRDTLLIVITRATPETFAALLREQDFVYTALAKLQPAELEEFIFKGTTNIMLDEIFSPLQCVYLANPLKHLFSQPTAEEVICNLLQRLSPFKLTETIGPVFDGMSKSETTPSVREAIKNCKLVCREIFDFVNSPGPMVKSKPEKFLAFLEFNLNNPNQIVTDPNAWLNVLTKAKSAVGKLPNILAKLDLHIWKLQKRPEFEASNSSVVKTNMWVELNELPVAASANVASSSSSPSSPRV